MMLARFCMKGVPADIEGPMLTVALQLMSCWCYPGNTVNSKPSMPN